MAITFKKRYPSAYELNKMPATGTVFNQLGFDMEWERVSGKPTLAGYTVASQLQNSQGQPNHLYSYWSNWNEPLVRSMLGSSVEMVGHNILSSDIPVLHKYLQFPVIPPKLSDTFVYFYLTNAHLCRARLERPADYDEANDLVHNDAAGGFMSIWTMASLYTDLPNWKECRGTGQLGCCEGPCPRCNPAWYCAIDSRAPLMALPQLQAEAKLKNVEHLYAMYEQVIKVTNMMTLDGIRCDQKKLIQLERQIMDRQDAIRAQLPAQWKDKEFPEVVDVELADMDKPINWGSHVQIKKYFKEKYGVAPSATGEEEIRSFYEEHNFPEAGLLLELKECGKGLKSWFGERWLDSDGFLHPQFKPVGGTSTGRWASKGPNFQNIPIRSELGKAIRSIIIARPGFKLYKSDYKQAEARCVLYESGLHPPADLKPWLLNQISLDANDPGVLALGGVWNATKSFMHAGHYGEGITLLTREELKSQRHVKEVAVGALEVYPDWTYQGKTVCRTGGNLATRMFGSATYDNRRKALSLQRRYFDKFPSVLKWQMDVSARIERDGYLTSPFGFHLLLYGLPFPTLKTGLAMLGSNPVAMYTNYAILRAADDGKYPIAQVHDELLWEFPESMPEKVAKAKIESYMCFEHPAMPGLTLPVDVSVGYSWGETQEIQ